MFFCHRHVFVGAFAVIVCVPRESAAGDASWPPLNSPSADCWHDGTPYTFELCCRALDSGFGGNPGCWADRFNFENCCLPELQFRVDAASQMVDAGLFRQASDLLFELLINYSQSIHGSGTELQHAKIFRLFEKASTEFRKELDRKPHSLSYPETLFSGLGLDCNTSDLITGNTLALDPLAMFYHCCPGLMHIITFRPRIGRLCWKIQEMLATALGRRYANGSIDDYYADMSEAWAFHIFTPSILNSMDVKDADEFIPLARKTNVNIAEAFTESGESMLGIVWGNHIQYQSPKYSASVYFLTLLFDTLRKASVTQEIEIFEIGAGYGTVPRLLASSRGRLAALQEPLNLHSYTVLDARYVINLQRWYLNKTVGSLIVQRDWAEYDYENDWGESDNWGYSPGGQKLWSDVSTSVDHGRIEPLRVDFVDMDTRDLFVHLHAESREQFQRLAQPVRVLVAINSWHEFDLSEYLWYYNTFVASPPWRSGVDWILYVSNEHWSGTGAKQGLLLQKRPNFPFEVISERCSAVTCIRILKRQA